MQNQEQKAATAAWLRAKADEIDPPTKVVVPACDLDAAMAALRSITNEAICLQMHVWDYRRPGHACEVRFVVWDSKNHCEAETLEDAVASIVAATRKVTPATVEDAQRLCDLAAAQHPTEEWQGWQGPVAAEVLA